MRQIQNAISWPRTQAPHSQILTYKYHKGNPSCRFSVFSPFWKFPRLHCFPFSILPIMEGSLPYEATQVPSTDTSPTSPKAVHFSTPTIIHKQQEEKELPKLNFPRNIISGFKIKRAKSPRNNRIALPRQLPERKPLKTLSISDLSFSPMDASIDAQPYRWPHNGGFSPETTALVIIDMQKDCKSTKFMIVILRQFSSHFRTLSLLLLYSSANGLLPKIVF